MDADRRRRLAELQQVFSVTVVDGETPPDDTVAESVALYLNRRNGRPVVVRRP